MIRFLSAQQATFLQMGVQGLLVFVVEDTKLQETDTY
jgi:hypothetical protein